MIEAYAFLAVFTLQILALSVLYPAWFTRYLRRQAASVPAEHLAQLYPGVDFNLARKRFLTGYRALNAGIAVLGLLLLGWLFSHMRNQGWHVPPVELLVAAYSTAQWLLPLGLVVRHGVGFNRRPLLEAKRKAILQRRGLFDFVSPWAVFVAALNYVLFVAFVMHIQRGPFSGFSRPVGIGVLTLVYVLQAFVVYAALYGKKPNPLQTNADRVRTIGLIVKSCVYSCIACDMYLSLSFVLPLVDLPRWEPFALSVFCVISAFLALMGMTAPPRVPAADGLAS